MPEVEPVRTGAVRLVRRRRAVLGAAGLALLLVAPAAVATPSQIIGYDVTTVAGNGVSGYKDGPGDVAEFSYPIGVAVLPDGHVYVADTGNHRIRLIDPTGHVTTLAGNGTAGASDGHGANAEFAHPAGITVLPDGTAYVADSGNSMIRRVEPNGDVTTVAGSSGVPGDNDGPGGTATFMAPEGISAVTRADGSVAVFVGDRNLVRRVDIDPVTQHATVTTVAGDGTFGFADGQGSAARFHSIEQVDARPDGTVYVADRGNHRVRKVDPFGNVTTFAGTGVEGYVDGDRATAQFFNIFALTALPDGSLYVGDQNLLRLIAPDGTVTTVAGFEQGFADGDESVARFEVIVGLSDRTDGTLYLSDYFNHRVRKVTPVRDTPPTAVIQSAPAALSNDNTPVVSFSSDDAAASYECSLTAGDAVTLEPFFACTSPLAFAPPLPDARYTFAVRATSALGTLGPQARATFTIDTTPPAPPSVPDLVATSDTGPSSTDDVTSDDTPTFTGSAEAGAYVTVTVDGTPQATSNADGVYSSTSMPLALGAHVVTATARDGAGNVSAPSGSLTVTIVPSNACYRDDTDTFVPPGRSSARRPSVDVC